MYQTGCRSRPLTSSESCCRRDVARPVIEIASIFVEIAVNTETTIAKLYAEKPCSRRHLLPPRPAALCAWVPGLSSVWGWEYLLRGYRGGPQHQASQSHCCQSRFGFALHDYSRVQKVRRKSDLPEKDGTRTRTVDLHVTVCAIGVLGIQVMLRASWLDGTHVVRSAVARQTELCNAVVDSSRGLAEPCGV